MRGVLTISGVLAAFAALGLANRWDAPRTAADAGAVQAKLDSVPMRLGEWEGTPTTIDAGHLRVAEANAHLSRTYRKGGIAVNVLVLFGEPGPLGAHTPDVCYRSAGFQQVGRETRRAVPGTDAELWTARFDGPGVPAAALQVSWGWTAGAKWVAADNPRIAFAGHAGIFKLYLARSLAPNGDRNPDPDAEFLRVFLKEFEQHTVPLSPLGRGVRGEEIRSTHVRSLAGASGSPLTPGPSPQRGEGTKLT